MQKPYLLRGKTEQFFDPHYQLAVFGHNEDEYPFAVSLISRVCVHDNSCK